MKWLAKMWRCLIGTPEECFIEDPKVVQQVKALVKRAFVLGFIAGFIAVALFSKGFATL